MIRHHLKIAIRNLLLHKIYTLINILGLAVGMACTILIGLYIQNEYTVDQFHSKSDRIYRIVRETQFQDQGSEMRPDTSGPLAPTIQQEIPEIEMAVRNMGLVSTQPWVAKHDKGKGRRFRVVDQHFFAMFDFVFLRGDPKTALQKPHSVVITKSLAQFYFGNTDPIGQTLDVASDYFDKSYEVTGVIQNHHNQSSIQFDMVTATVHDRWYPWTQWLTVATWRPIHTYILVAPNTDINALEQKLQHIMARNMGDDIAKYNAYHLQPLNRVHLYSTEDFGFAGPSDIRHIQIFTAIALFILLIACINFMNLSTARAISRAKEVGLRKVVGAQRWHLTGQFLGESLLISFLSLLIALGLALLSLPSFNHFVQKELTFNITASSSMACLILALVVGILSGSYPALLLSRFAPVQILKGTSRKTGSGDWIRKGLVIFQFAISILLIIGTGIVYDQVHYMRSANLGFDTDHIIVTPLLYTHKVTYPQEERLSFRYSTVKKRLLDHPNILKATAYRSPIGNHGDGILRQFEKSNEPGVRQNIRIQEADEDFLNTFDIQLLAGRNFKIDEPGQFKLIINQTTAKKMGWDTPLEESFVRATDNTTWPIIGVVKDTHMRHLQHETSMQAYRFNRSLLGRFALKVKSENLDETLTHIETIWNDYLPTRPFEYTFVDDQIDRMYHADIQFGQTFSLFATLAIFLGCLGLFGLTSYTTIQRTKEIGIRKVLGASTNQVTVMLAKTFLYLVVIANVIAWPLAYIFMDHWLQNYAHRTDLKFTTFILSGLLTLIIAIFTVSYQAIKTARTNPTDALRYE